MTGLVRAVRYLTIVPVAGGVTHGMEALGRAAPWFPVVGLGIGAVLVTADAVARALHAPLLAAVLTVSVWKVLTGGLHLDGLADCLDGLAGRDAEHRLAIMRDSGIGAFGATGLILVLMLAVVTLSEIPAAHRWRALLAAPVIARGLAALVGRLFRPARLEGSAVAFARGLGAGGVAASLAVSAAVAVAALRAAGAVALAAAALAALLVGRAMARRLGGITGDVHGAVIETAELVVMLTALVWFTR